MPFKDGDVLVWPNDEISGVRIEFYHLSAKEHKHGGEHKFGIRTLLPHDMHDTIDWDKANEMNEDGEAYRRSFGAGSLMNAVVGFEKTVALHPNCLEVTDFFGIINDVSDFAIDKMMEDMLKGVAESQYEGEKERGLVPHGMSFDEWCEVAGPEGGDPLQQLQDWDPKGKSN